ncbi:MBL fold metallo-hydrolase [bacterium]|nr:MBL fold metallo-hydrolase [bacterium]
MQRERVTDAIYVFTSDRYASVTAGVVVTSEGAVVIDTLVYPEESLAIRHFVNQKLGLPVRYVINTHHHADHTTGTCFFEGATVIAQEQCRTLLDTRGRESLEHAKDTVPEMQDVRVVLPQVVFERHMTLYCGNKTLRLWSSPGHSVDSLVCLVEEDGVLFGADTLMPVPYFVDGNLEDFRHSLEALRQQTYETVVQGHGEVVLRGEIEEKIASDLNYLSLLEKAVDSA